MTDSPENNNHKQAYNNKDRLTGLIIDKRYMIQRRIASGGMADVYEGTDTKLKKKIAVKILNEAYSGTRSFTARFEKEAQILSKLKSPNIISVYDYGQFEGLYFIIMEFISGRSLKQVIEAKGAFEPKTAAAYAVQVCNALEIAHNNNLIHRDIKPQNILLDDRGSLKVTDFGIAKYTTVDATRTVNILGTAHYLSPEQAQGKSLDNRTDIYSLGILMYEMLVSDVPFRGGSSIDISIRHISEKPQPPSEIVSNIPPFLEYIILKCLEKNPDDRYQDIRDLKRDLKNFIENRLPVHGKFYKNGYKSGTFIQGNTKNINVKKYFEISKYRKIVISLLFSTLAFFILFLVFIALFLITEDKLDKSMHSQEMIEVPQLLNTEIKSAEKILAGSGLKIIIDSEVYNDEIPPGFIISQEPESGNTVMQNSEIYVDVSKGARTLFVNVPNLTGLALSDAEKMLNEAGLSAGALIEEYSDIFKKGTVYSQEPSPFVSVELETAVDLTISKGRDLVTIPDFKGYDYHFAKSNLEAMDLHVYTKVRTDPSLPPGTVTGTEPAEGSTVEKNSIILLFISTNEEMIIVPDLSDLDAGIAAQRLAEMNLLYEISPVKVDYSIQKNTVLSQFPEPFEQIKQGDVIILFVGQ